MKGINNMKKTSLMTKDKKPYMKPDVEEVQIDNDICLLMASGGSDDETPSGPDDDGASGGIFG